MHLKKMKYIILLIISFGGLSAYVAHQYLQTRSLVTMTVFVHGTYPALGLLAHPFSPVRYMIYAKPGLHLAQALPEHYHFHKVAKLCHSYDSVHYNIDHFYTYGWHSSKLRSSHRCNEGKKLYEAINEKLKEYRQKYDYVSVRLVGSSHGGNVILNTLSHLPFETPNSSVEVILLGTPVQEETRDFINNQYVTCAYSFYSTTDWIQRIDPQKFHKNCPKSAPFLSNRTFLPNDKVIQIQTKVNGKSVSHTQYRNLFGHLPKMMDQVCQSCNNQKNQHLCIDFKIPN